MLPQDFSPMNVFSCSMYYRVSQKNLCTLEDTSTLSCTHFLAEFFGQEGIFSHHFYQRFRNRWPFVIWTNMLGVIDPQSYHIVYCALCQVDKGYTNSSSSVTLRVSNSYHVYSNDKRSMVPESLIKMVRENAFLPKKSRQETCAGKGWSVLQSGNFFWDTLYYLLKNLPNFLGGRHMPTDHAQWQ